MRCWAASEGPAVPQIWKETGVRKRGRGRWRLDPQDPSLWPFSGGQQEPGRGLRQEERGRCLVE